MNQPLVFISCVSPEFRQTRSRVAAILTRLGYTPVIQEIFSTEPGDLRQVLRDKIDSCEGLIQIVGHGYGAEPPTVDANMAGSHTPRFEVDQLAAANTFSAHVNQCSLFWIANCLIEKVRAIGYHMAVSQEGYFAGYTMIPVFGVLLPPDTSIAKGVSRRAAGLTMLCVMCYASRKSSVVF